MKHLTKKIFAGALSLALVVAVAGCGGKVEDHVHTPEGDWFANAEGHWKLCSQCEERTEVRKHTLDELSKCTVCNSEVLIWDSFASIYTYDDHENIIRMADYDLEGNLTDEMIYENEYDALGNLSSVKEYLDGRFASVSEYAQINGENVTVKYTCYNEDDTMFINEYDDYGNVILMIDYDREGKETLRSESVYVQDDQEQWYQSECTETYADGKIAEMKYDVKGSTISRITYEADGTLSSTETWEFTYFDNNFAHTEKAYVDGVLISETVYQFIEESDYSYSFPETVTTYFEDGTYHICVYNEFDELVSETLYDANGNVI